MSNAKQLGLAWNMYASDHDDVALGPIPTRLAPAWCDGNVVSAPEAIDNRFTTNSPTYKYLSTPEIFHCPAGNAGLRNKGQIVLRNRSYVMNAFIGHTLRTFSLMNSNRPLKRRLQI